MAHTTRASPRYWTVSSLTLMMKQSGRSAAPLHGDSAVIGNAAVRHPLDPVPSSCAAEVPIGVDRTCGTLPQIASPQCACHIGQVESLLADRGILLAR